jgi:MFS family permease
MDRRPGANLGCIIGGIFGMLAGYSIGGTLSGPVGSTRGEIGAVLGFLVGLGFGLILGYWVGAGTGSLFTRRAQSRSRAASTTRKSLTQPPERVVDSKRETLAGRIWALIGLVFGLLLIFSIVWLPGLVLAAVGIGLALNPTTTYGLAGQICGGVFAAACLFYLGLLGYSTLRRIFPRRSRGKGSDVLLEAATEHGPGTLQITASTVLIIHPPTRISRYPRFDTVPRSAIAFVTSRQRRTGLYAFFGVLTDVVIHTTDGKERHISGVPFWQAREVLRVLSRPSGEADSGAVASDPAPARD